jgi:hypothetical protein
METLNFKLLNFKQKKTKSSIRMFVLWKKKPETNLLIAGINAHSFA